MTEARQTAARFTSYAVDSFATDQEGRAISFLRDALAVIGETDDARSPLLAAVKAFEQGNDSRAASFAQSALERLRA